MHANSVKAFAIALPLLAAGLLAIGCYPKAAAAPGTLAADKVTWAQGQWPGTTAESLAAGQASFVAKCNNCHGYPGLDAYTDERWPSIIESMGKKADLTPPQRDSVLHYVLAAKHQ